MSKPATREQGIQWKLEYENLGLSSAALADKHNVPVERVKFALKEAGTKMRTHSEAALCRRYKNS